MSPARLVPPEVLVNQYILETLPEGLPYFKEFESKLLKELMTLPMPKIKSHLPASVPYPMQFRQKRYSTSLFFQPDPITLENHVHNRLMMHNPSLLPYAHEIQNDVLLFLWYMKLMRMSALSSSRPNFDGIFTNRNDIKRGFYSFLSFIRDNFSKASLRYPPDVKHIKNDVDGALRRLGMVKKRKNIFK